MAKGAQSHRNSKPSISYKYNPHGGASFDLVDVANEDYAPSSHNNNTKPTNHAEARSSIVSTADVISGAGQLWKFATSSLPVLRHRPTSVQDTEIIQKRNTICYPAEEGSIIASISSEGQNVSVNLKSDSDVSPTEYLHKDYEPYSYGYLSRCMLTDNGKIFLSSNEKMVSRVRVSDELQYIYGWMNAMQLLRPTCNNDMTARNDVCYNESAENQESLCNENSQNTKSVIKTDHLLQEESQHEKEENCFDIKEGQKSQPLNQENSVVQINSPQSYKSKYGIAKQEHAFAGAFAGVFVSLCLHPMDTVKTVVQSCHADQRSIPYISKSIISERGLLGLYRGIASNIASSAPISAIYTFSYESVKAALLPLFAKEYHSLAHCAAGGCASVATSFVFTPSERIKQQMQISSHYRSCWNALMGIVKNGGFLSLYNGWGAVLCRNVPHSIIKFYTYESLKNVLLTSNEARGQPTTISTLLCGGLAGSTAALFTTPFDVVKTRLQTQGINSGMKIQGLVDAAKNYHTVLKENRKLYNEVQDLKGNIRVYCRIRPFLKGQSKKQTIIEYIGDNGELVVSNRSKIVKENHRAFKFNKVFGPAATQEEVFVDTQPLIRSVLDGYNVCIFAYGQTGSGKTYTMSGPNVSSQEAWGVNYRALNDLFRLSQIRRSSFDYEIGVQMVEIYNEQVRDLLSSDSTQKRLGIWNSTQPNGLTVPDASMHAVTSTTDVIELMNVGLMNRAVGATVLNERSSRSHSVLTVHVRGTDLETNTVLRGNLHLVDLAGSERVDRSEATGERLREAQHINKSLSALGDVIFALAQKSQHIPYRNSKLTQVLQSSLGGQAKTLMFVQLNPEVESFSETISTLKFAERVSGVELGAAHSNKEERGVRELMEQVTSLKDALTKKDEEIARLQQSETGSHQSADEFGNQKDFFEQSRLVKANGINDDIGLSRLMDADSESDIADGFRPIVPAKLPRPPQKTTPSSRTLMQTNLSLQRASLSKGPPHTASGSSVRKSTSGGVSFKSGAGW